MKPTTRQVFLASLSSFALVLAACGSDEQKPTQVAAKVNKDEITVHQINFAMQRLGSIPEAQAKQAQKQVLDRLVDQQLLVQQAMDKKLDRDPPVVQAIEAAKRQILAQAYVQQVMGGAEKASGTQVKDFYESHPELFKERRVYRFAQMTIAAPADKQASLKAKLEELDKQADKSQILPEMGQWLRAQNLQFRATQVTQGAEQLPLEALPKYQKMSIGDLLYSPGPQGVVIAQIVAAQNLPLTQEQAQPFIEQYLQNRERMRLSDEAMKQLRSAAKIEYKGDFEKLAGEPTAGSGAVSSPEPASAAAGTGASAPPDDKSLEKGLSGLK